MASINNLIGGNFADIGNFLNFGDIDIGSIATVAVIGIAAIFVLPQAIYWITGITITITITITMTGSQASTSPPSTGAGVRTISRVRYILWEGYKEKK